MSTKERERFTREMAGITARVEKLRQGHPTDPPTIQGLRGFVALAWSEIAAQLPAAEAYMTTVRDAQPD